MFVLIIDNDPVNRLVTAAFLRHAGCATACASDDDSASDLLQRIPFDLILMDMDTATPSETAGTHSVRHSEGLNALTPVLGIATTFSETLKPGTVAADMDGYLVKPYDPDELAKMVGRLSGYGKMPCTAETDGGWWWHVEAILKDGRFKHHAAGFTDEYGTDKARSMPGCGKPVQHSALDE